MSDQFEEFHFPLLYGAQNHQIWTIWILFLFLGPISLRIELRFWVTFLSLKIGIVLYVRLLCLIICNKQNVACSLKSYRLLEKGALTLVISRSSRWHTTNIICWSAAAPTACCISKGHAAQGPRVVARHGPFRGTVFVKPQKRTLIRHKLGCSELKG